MSEELSFLKSAQKDPSFDISVTDIGVQYNYDYKSLSYRALLKLVYHQNFKFCDFYKW